MTEPRTLAGEIRGRCRELSGEAAIHFVSKAMGDWDIRWDELLSDSERVANDIRQGAAASTGVVVIVLDHSMELLYSLVGSILAGRTPTVFSLPSVKMNIPKYFESLPKLLANAEADLMITSQELYGQFRTWGIPFEGTSVMVDGKIQETGRTPFPPAPPNQKQPAILQYSSGTTGLRKGVALGDDAILHQIDHYGAAIRLSPDDVIISWLPLYHDMGLIACCLLPLVKGIPVVWMSPFEWLVDPAMWFQYSTRFRATLSWLPNFSYNYAAAKLNPEQLTGVNLSSLRGIINCSEPVRPDSHRIFYEKFKSYGLRRESLGACYALAEDTFAVTEGGITNPVIEETVDAEDFFRNNRARPAGAGGNGYRLMSSGRPFPGQDVKIVDSQRKELPARQVGEISIRSLCLMSGYYKNDEVTAKSMDADGWFYTGDLGFLTEEKDLFVTGRSKDMIIVSGVNIYPSDIEYLISTVPGVHPGRVAAFGVYNEEKGTEELVVIAEKEKEWAERGKEIEVAIRRHVSMCAECQVSDIRLVPHMWLLKSSSGKIARVANKEKYISAFKK